MGPYSTNKLCAATANAGGLGIISLMGMGVQHCEVTPVDPVTVFGEGTTEDYVRRSLAFVKRETSEARGVFGVNCPVPDEFTVAAQKLLGAVFSIRGKDSELRDRLRVVITSAGDPVPWAERIRAADILWFHVVPSIYHAQRAEAAGVDAIIASGHEGGGHISWQPVHSMVLIPGVVDQTSLPVIAAGGICDGRTVAAAFALGAVGVQMGTRFIATEECDFWDGWKRTVLQSSDRDTVVGRGMFGPMRLLRNRFSDTLADKTLELAPELMRGRPVGLHRRLLELETEGLARLVRGDDPERSLMLGGEVAGRIADLPTVRDLIERITTQAELTMTQLCGSLGGSVANPTAHTGPLLPKDTL
jgi:NAD(P)H-dependent flavin oxidoreductase YrpB (nitropropane dioxygenase family)